MWGIIEGVITGLRSFPLKKHKQFKNANVKADGSDEFPKRPFCEELTTDERTRVYTLSCSYTALCSYCIYFNFMSAAKNH